MRPESIDRNPNELQPQPIPRQAFEADWSAEEQLADVMLMLPIVLSGLAGVAVGLFAGGWAALAALCFWVTGWFSLKLITDRELRRMAAELRAMDAAACDRVHRRRFEN